MLHTNKTIRSLSFFVALFIGVLSPADSFATHAAGGEIAYEWISDSTYKIIFKFYRDCSGAGEPATVPLCYRNTCNSQGGTITLTKISKLPDSTTNGSPVTLGCPGNGTRCNNTSSTVPGYREWWYAATVTLPSRCNFWRFSVSIGNRNSSGNLVGASGVIFHAEATLNNLTAQGNSSPYFSVKPVPSICINQPYTYNNGGVDPNSDSLSFDILMPLQTNGACPPTTSNMTFATATPSYNLTNNPLQTNNTFSISPSTGQMTFTPGVTGAGTLTVRIREYRNGVLIGYVMRDIQVQVINCSVTAPIVNTVNTTVTGGALANGRIEACAGVQLGFCFDLKSTDTAAIIVASDNSASATPGAVVTYTGQRTDSVRGCLTWTPSTLDTGLRVFSVTAKDSTCVSPGVIVAQTFVLPIYIWPITDIIRDTTICYGDSVTLLAVGGSAFTWSVLPGGASISTLSCTTCKQPVASPLVNTQYIVTNSATQYCSKNSDTVTVNVLDIRNDTLVGTGITPICQGDTLKLFSSTAISTYGYRWTGPNSFASSLQNPILVNAPLANSGNYILRSFKQGCFSKPDTVPIQIKPLPGTPTVTNNGPLCTGTALNLTASTISGAGYSWTGPNSFTSTTQNPTVANVQLVNAGTYTVFTTLDGCKSPNVNTNVVVNVKPVISSYSFSNPTTCGGTNGFIVLNGLAGSTSYTVEYKLNGSPQTTTSTSSSTGSVVLTTLGAGTYSQLTVATAFCRSDTIAPIILITPIAPVVTASSNSPICQGDTLKLFATSDSSGVTWLWTGPSSFTSTSQNPIIASAATTRTGTYNVTATKYNCTSAVATIAVVVNARPTAPTASSNSPVCTGSTLNLSASTISGTTYSWTGPNSFTSTVQNPSVNNAQLVNAGTYTVTSIQNGCTSATAGSTLVVVNPKPAIGTISFVNPSTCLGNNGIIVLNGLASSTSYTVNYRKNTIIQAPLILTSSSTGSLVITNLTAGVYSQINVTTLGCTSDTIAPITLTDPKAPVVSATSNTPICQSDTLKLFATSDSTGVIWAWNGPLSFTSTNQNPVIISALPTMSGIYKVVASKNNCTSDTATVSVLVKPTPTTPVASSNSPLCSGSTLQLQASVITGAIYSWTGPLLFSSTLRTPTISSVDTPNAGVYTVTAFVNGCASLPGTTTVIIYHVPEIDTFNFTHPTTCGGNNGTITLTGLKPSTAHIVEYKKNGVTQPPIFTASNSIGNIIITGLTAGVYSNIVVLLNGCTSDSISAITLLNPKAPVITASNNGPICQGDTLKLFATSDSTGVTWSWTGPMSFTSATQNPVLVNSLPVMSGIYRINAIKNNCVSDTVTTTVLVKPTPSTPDASSNSPLCAGSTLNLSSNFVTGATYSWTGPLAFTSALQNPSITNADTFRSGNYILTVSVAGCLSLPDTAAVVINHIPAIDSFSFEHPSTCFGTDGNITLKGMRANTTYIVNYLKNGATQPPVSITSGSNGRVVMVGLSAGLYSRIKVTLSGCTSDTLASILLINPQAPVITATNNGPICQGDTLKLFGTSDSTGVIWSWIGPLSYTSSLQNPQIINAAPTVSGVYTLIATKNNCPSIAVGTTVLVKPTPVTPNAGSNSPICSGSTLQLTSTTVAGATYTWVGPSSYTASVQNPARVNADTFMSGDYIVVATVNGCPSLPDTVSVLINHLPEIDTFSYTHPTTCFGTDGSIMLYGLKPSTTYTVSFTKNGFAQPSQWLLTNTSGRIVISGLSAGTYSHIAVTLNNCTSDSLSPITLIDPTPPVITATFTNTTTCSGAQGTITISGLTNAITYTVNYTKNTIAQPPLSLTANSSGNVTITGLTAGVYNNISVIVNNCLSNTVGPYTLVDPIPPVIALADSADPVSCSGSQGFITIGGLISGNVYSVDFSKNAIPQITQLLTADISGRITINGLGAGIYTNLRVTFNNCISNSVGPVTLSDPLPPTVSNTNNTPICQGDTIKLFASSVSGVTYSWTGPGGFSSSLQNPILINALPSQAGNYIVTATLNNCVSVADTTVVIVHPTPGIPTARNNGPLCTGNTLLLTADTIIGAGYSWVGPGGYTSLIQNPIRLNAQPSFSGTYTVVATVNGCVSPSSSTVVTIFALPAPIVSGFAITHPTTCFGSNGSITISGLVANTNYTVNYKRNTIVQPFQLLTTSALGTLTISGLTAGAYTDVVVTAPNGCSSDPLLPIILVDPTPPVISYFTKANPTTCLGSNGSITISGLTNNFIYTINYSRNTLAQPSLSLTADINGRVVLPGLTAGSYNNITATINNCTSNQLGPIILNDPTPPVAIANNNTPICQGDSLKLFGGSDSTGVAWSWTGPNSFSATNQNPVIINAVPAHSGPYILVVSKNNCVSIPDTTDVLVKPTPPAPAPTNNGPLCEGNTLQLFAITVPGGSYAWTGPLSFTDTNQYPSIPGVTVLNSGVYKVRVTLNGCLSPLDSTIVLVSPIPLAPAANLLINYCQGDVSFPLTATGANLQWYSIPIGGTPSSVAPTPPTNIAGSQYYYVTQKISNCESPRTRIQVVIRPKPLKPASDDTVRYCQYEVAKPLQATGSTIKWYTQATGGMLLTTAPTPATNVAGVYKWYVSQTSFNGCESDKKEITVIILPQLTPDIEADRLTFCKGDTIIITDKNIYTGNIVTHTWAFAGGVVIEGDTSGPYTLSWADTGSKTIYTTVTNGVCTAKDSLLIRVNYVPDAFFEMPADVCLNEKVFLLPRTQLKTQCIWDTDGGVITDSVRNERYGVKWSTLGKKIVTLKLQADNGCISKPFTDTTEVHVLPIAKIERISRNDICAGDSLELVANKYDDKHLYTWYGDANFFKTEGYISNASVPRTGYLYLKLNNIWGCEAIDSVLINTEGCCDVVLPDAFSPNGDGRNDIFRIITPGNHTVNSFIIVNRWGQKIFETRNQQVGWDGRFKGALQDIGTYHYYLKYKCADGRVIEKKGQVILVR